MESSKYYELKLEDVQLGLRYIHKQEMLGVPYYEYDHVMSKKDLLKLIKKVGKSSLYIPYMTQSDLIDLGWYLDQKTKDGFCFTYGNMIKGDYMLWTKDFKEIEIFNIIGTRNVISYKGNISNKIEFEKLMKQLKINE